MERGRGEEVARGGEEGGAVRERSCHPWMTFSPLPSMFPELCPPPTSAHREGWILRPCFRPLTGAWSNLFDWQWPSDICSAYPWLNQGHWQVWAGSPVSSPLTSTTYAPGAGVSRWEITPGWSKAPFEAYRPGRLLCRNKLVRFWKGNRSNGASS